MQYSEMVDFLIAHQHELHYWAFYYVKDRELVKDLVQDVAVILHSNKDSLDEVEEPMAYLKKAIKNRAYNLSKQRRRELYMGFDAMAVFPDHQAQREVKRIEAQMAVRTFLDGFPEDRVEAFLKCYLYGFAIDEVAQELNVSRNALDQQFFRMRSKIVKIAEKSGWFDIADVALDNANKPDSEGVGNRKKTPLDNPTLFALFLLTVVDIARWR